MTVQDAWPEDPNAQTPTPAKKGSGCAKAILIVGGVMFLMLLICGGGVGFFAYSFWPKVVDQPADVAAIRKEIVDLDVPEGFEPEGGIVINNFMVTMRMAVYRKAGGSKSGLVLGNFQIKMGKPDERPDLDFNNKTSQPMKLKLGNTEVKEFSIRGKQVPFRFSDATGEETDEKFRVVEGEFSDGSLTTFVKLYVPEDEYDEEVAIKMIESIR